MHFKALTTAALIAACSTTAMAGTVSIVDAVSDTSQFMLDFVGVNGAGNYAINRHTGLEGTASTRSDFETANQSFVFNTLAGAINPNDNGNFQVTLSGDGGGFHYGSTETLTSIDFNAGNDAAPAQEQLAFAFGNNTWTSESVTMAFNPGVTAFGFSYEDIGDVRGELTVTFSDGSTAFVPANSANNMRDGFISIVADAGDFITSIEFTQSNDPDSKFDDGFIFYGFSTIQTIPLPPAAFAGLGLLGGLGVARRLRRK